MRFSRRHPTAREAYRSWKLGRAIKSGTTARGRAFPSPEAAPPVARKRGGLWLEFMLRLRSLWAAIKFIGSTPVFSSPTMHEGALFPTGRLFARVRHDGQWEDRGLISTKVVTTAGVGFIVDAFQNSVELETMKYHGVGTGNTAEASSDTALVTEVETRGTGTTTEGASANIYRTVGTVSFANARAVVEHGIFSASSGGVLLDRSVFSVINVGVGDAIEFTYELTLPAGG